MLKQVSLTALILTSAIAAQTALAGGADCPAAPKEQWLSELDMQKRIVNEYGFSIRKFKVDDNCYEIYGMAPKAEGSDELVKTEVYFNPVNGEIVKQKLKD